MKNAMMILAGLLACVVLAQDVAAPVKGKRKKHIAGTPGYEQLQAPINGKWFRIVNGQGDVPNQAILEASRIFCGLFDLPLDFVDWGKTAPVRPDEKAGVVVFLDGNGDGPSLLAAPEDGWATVGVKALKEDNPTPEVLEARLKKQIWRAGCYALGIGIEATPSVLRPIAKPKDLDMFEDLCSTPVITPLVRDSAIKHGLGRIRIVTYRQACREGWAPAPTNDAQKAVWEKERAIPKNPMKIEFDSKKGR